MDGPLHPARIGESLAGMGLTKTHSMVFFLSFLIISLCWNWIFNIVSHLMGSRLPCNKVDEEGKPERVFKYKKRKHYRRTRGHRQSFTAVRIDAVRA